MKLHQLAFKFDRCSSQIVKRRGLDKTLRYTSLRRFLMKRQSAKLSILQLARLGIKYNSF